MDVPFSAIRQSKVSEDIVEQVKGLIRDGRLQPGQKLPSERQLSQVLKVGRSSLREAVNSLAMMGLVEIKQRKGIYVRSVSAPLVTDPLRHIMDDDRKVIANLYDIRMDIEVASARAAARSRSDAQLTQLGQCLDAAQTQNGESCYRTKDDLAFHTAIAEATGNFLRIHIINEVFSVAGQYIRTALDKVVSKPGSSATIHEQHKAIYQAIAGRLVDEAGDAMFAHLKWVKSQFEAYL